MKRIIAILFFLTLQMSCAHANQTLSLGNAYGAPMTTPNKDGLFDLIYQELSHRTGIKIVIQNADTAERVLLNANSGVDDGDVGRVAGLEKRYTNLVYVPVPVYHYQMVVFSKKLEFPVDGARSIQPYDIGLLKGWKIVENISQGARSVTSVETGEQLFSMLDKNRIDIALIEKAQGLAILKTLRLKDIRLLQPNLLEGDWYLYLNQKHANLVPRISSELEKMHRDGTIKRINERVSRTHGYQQ